MLERGTIWVGTAADRAADRPRDQILRAYVLAITGGILGARQVPGELSTSIGRFA